MKNPLKTKTRLPASDAGERVAKIRFGRFLGQSDCTPTPAVAMTTTAARLTNFGAGAKVHKVILPCTSLTVNWM
jgi:hypothetical protein